MSQITESHTNSLINETSPYLLQHAHNPVNWEPWSREAFKKAEAENKLVIVSIGYSACHWCHVMEKESFEDLQVARIMNDNFICIKVDREERPDVDQLFMDAAQLMIGRGGWPLNAFALPDGRPVYAGTYFPKIAWMGLLKELSYGYRKQPEKYFEYAAKLISGIEGMSMIAEVPGNPVFKPEDIDEAFFSLVQQVDRKDGGRGRAPKFPMPDNWLFLLRYHHITGNEEALNLTLLTLDKMANGGIYDQIGGGFARYSTDQYWKVPHFEKMLYDNVQLIDLYSEAYLITGNVRYKDIVYQTISFFEREMLSEEGAFFCALDADSEGVEGKFYVWKSEEIQHVCGDHAEIIKDWYGVGTDGLWENDENILLIATTLETLSLKYSKTEADIKRIISEAGQKLLNHRNLRVRPGLDHKILLSWNAMAVSALIKAWKVFNEPYFKALASGSLSFIRTRMIVKEDLFHSYQKGNAKIPGFLEDYCFFIKALFDVYQADFNEEILYEARKLLVHVMDTFSDSDSGFFWFTSSANNELATRKIENGDNVIPSPNSVMAYNLFLAGRYFEDTACTKRSERMLQAMLPDILENAAYFSNWAILLAYQSGPFYEAVFTGENTSELITAFNKTYHPNVLVSVSQTNSSQLPLSKGKGIPGKSLIYICENAACLRPVESVKEAVDLLKIKSSQ